MANYLNQQIDENQLNNQNQNNLMPHYALMADQNQNHTAMGNYGINQGSEPKNYQ